MTKRRRYTDDFRANAVLMLEAAGYPNTEGALTSVARHLKVPHQTLSRWGRGTNNPPPPLLVQEKKASLVELLETELEAIFKEMGKARQDATYQQLGTVAGIFFDKRQLLTGGPTENVDMRSVKVVEIVRPSNST